MCVGCRGKGYCGWKRNENRQREVGIDRGKRNEKSKKSGRRKGNEQQEEGKVFEMETEGERPELEGTSRGNGFDQGLVQLVVVICLTCHGRRVMYESSACFMLFRDSLSLSLSFLIFFPSNV